MNEIRNQVQNEIKNQAQLSAMPREGDLESRLEPHLLPVFSTVLHNRQESAEVFTLEIALPSGITKGSPGQFYMLYVFGVGEVPISISGFGPNSVFQTIKNVGSVTKFLCALKAGDTVGIRGPFGSCWPSLPAHKLPLVRIFIAGGVGLPPLRPLILEAEEKNIPAMIFYGTRSAKDILFLEDFYRWQKNPLMDIFLSVDKAGPEPESWVSPISIGFVTQNLQKISKFSVDTYHCQVFTCGPEIMMKNAIGILLQNRIPPQEIFLSFERNMKCATGHCGRCQWGPFFLCQDGPVFPFPQVQKIWEIKEY